MALTYRSVKGSALTIAELDGNFRHFTGSHSISGSLIVSGSSIVTGSLKVSGSGTLIGTLVVTGSMTISGSSITDYGNQTYNIDANQKHKVVSGSNTYLMVSGSGKVGIGTATPDAGLHIVPERTATNNTASLHISGAFYNIRIENLPTARPVITGSLWLSGSAGAGSKYLAVFTG